MDKITSNKTLMAETLMAETLMKPIFVALILFKLRELNF